MTFLSTKLVTIMMFTNNISNSLLNDLLGRSPSLRSSSNCCRVKTESIVEEHEFRLFSFLTSFIHEFGGKHFATQYNVSFRRLAACNAFSTIPIDMGTQYVVSLLV